jgi:aminopeptidase YwaD
MKKIKFFLLLITLTIPSLKSQTINPYYQEIVTGVKYDTIYNRLQTFENFGNKGINSQGLKNTAQWIIDFYTNLGYTNIEIDTFTHSGNQLYNIIITKTGTEHPDKYFIIDGHYDAANCPGTDDNGSGTVIIMEVARLLRDVSTKCSIKFIHFSAEESGLVGSQHYVTNTVIPQNMDILLLLNIDMVGGTSGMSNNIIKCERDEAGQSQNNAASYAYTDTLATLTSLYSNLQTQISNAYGSDYMPFEQNGNIITGYYEYNENPYNHSLGDILAHMDPASVNELTKAATGASLYFSQAYYSSGINNKSNSKSSFIMGPNPSDGILNIYSEKNVFFTLTTLIGEKLIDSILIRKGQQTIDVKKFQAGSYIYTISNEDKEIEGSGKIIIK